MIEYKPYSNDVLANICRKLEGERCADHRKHPFAQQDGNDIRILACCDKFRHHLEDIKKAALDKVDPVDLPNKKYALVVDREIDFCHLMEFYLRKKGFEVVYVISLKRIDEVLRDKKPGVIFIENMLYQQTDIFESYPADLYIIDARPKRDEHQKGLLERINELFQ